jgi:imidazolonepropionase
MPGRKRVAKTDRGLLLANIAQLLTLRPATASPGPRRGPALNHVGLIKDAAVLCLGGKIVAAGSQREILRHASRQKHKSKITEVDFSRRTVLPGFVDSHTHLVFAAPRLADFEKRIAGATYEQIAEAGGGIRSSVAGVRKATTGELAKRALAALREMAAQGTCTVEAKSGYGLDVANELKSLQAIRQAGAKWEGTVVSTLLGAHALSLEPGRRPGEYLREVCEEMIPQAAQKKLAAYVDVFCDRGAFSLRDAEKIFAAAEKHGLGARAHVGQLTASKLAPLLKFNAASLDHLDCIDSADIAGLAASDTVATLLPGANYFLGLDRYPPARQLIDAGAAVALATDYNPGSSPTTSMPFILSLACTHMRMSPAEAIVAATINGAHALGLSASKGSLEPGKDADLAVFDFGDYRELAYWFASNHCGAIIIGGKLLSRA